MKNQYFADKNDYFKYDLVISLANGLPDIVRFTFIPMLTPDDNSRDGQLINYDQRTRREDLFLFLHSCLEGPRKVSRLREFFRQPQVCIEYCPYGDQVEFRHSERSQYFQEIPPSYLRQAVILLDPDNGLEVKSAATKTFHRYVKYEEVRSVFHRMDKKSLLVIYQHFPRVERRKYLRELHRRLQKEIVCPPPIAIWDARIAFIGLARSPVRRRQVARRLNEYANRVEGLSVFCSSGGP